VSADTQEGWAIKYDDTDERKGELAPKIYASAPETEPEWPVVVVRVVAEP